MLKVRLAAACFGFAALLSTTVAALAQTETNVPAPPLPSQILAAKKVFISNTGNGFDSSAWSGGPNRIYDEFYMAMKNWERYELAGAPGDADLVLDVNVIRDSVVWQFKLEILDPRTGIVLWTQYEPIKITVSQKTRDKNFDDTINKLVVDLKALTAQPAVANTAK
ncbi:MAG: hypothetical protein ABSB60_17520 [Terracidiphilus sp.]|jgi:hypothetical protein